MFGPRVSVEGLTSGTHEVTINIVRARDDMSEPAADITASTANQGLSPPESHFSGASPPPASTATQHSATLLASDTVLIDVVGPGWQGADQIRNRRNIFSAASRQDAEGGGPAADEGEARVVDLERHALGGGGDGGGDGDGDSSEDVFEDSKFSFFTGSIDGDDGDERGGLSAGACLTDVGRECEEDDSNERRASGSRTLGERGAGDTWVSPTRFDEPEEFEDGDSQEEEKTKNAREIVKIAVVSNTLEDHSQNRAFAKLCAGSTKT